MKTKNSSLRLATIPSLIAALLGFVLMTASCQNKSDSKEESGSKVSNIKAPDVDIHTAVITENIAALKQHIAAGSNLNEREPFGGSSPLINAAVFGKTEAAKVLIDAGADLNFQNNDGSTALISAAYFCRTEIVKMLLEKGADKTITNKYGATAFQSVSFPFADAKSSYEMMGQMLKPMGLNLDYAYIEKTRPEIATILK
jgi:ankyrin repeat protein